LAVAEEEERQPQEPAEVPVPLVQGVPTLLFERVRAAEVLLLVQGVPTLLLERVQAAEALLLVQAVPTLLLVLELKLRRSPSAAFCYTR
jgi:hypothetical protein